MKKSLRYLVAFFVTTAATVFPGQFRDSKADSRSTSMAELMSRESAGKDWGQRKGMLLDHAAHFDTKNEQPLRENHGALLQAAGRDKAAMVLHQLKLLLGGERFARIAEKTAAEPQPMKELWGAVEALAEKEAGRDLSWFFKQWLDRKGLPELGVENASVRKNGGKYEVRFDLVQQGDPYILDVPYVISFLRGKERAESTRLDSGRQQVSVLVDEEPASVAIDRDYDVPRRLTGDETPPLLAQALHELTPILVGPASNTEFYRGIIEALKARGFEPRPAAGVKDADIRTSSLIVLGGDNPVIGRLFGQFETGDDELRLRARKNPWKSGAVIVTVAAASAQATGEAARILADAGDASAVIIDKKGSVLRTTEDSDRGIVMELREEPLAIDVSMVKSLEQVIEGAFGKKIVYVGEYHDRFAHHAVELRMIKALYRKNRHIAIGMEMFQRPFQKVLDEYIGGSIEEREFLKRTEYFSRWSFDFNLYKPILDFARAEKIPVVALNMQREITEKVSRQGMDALSDEERKALPAEMDLTDRDYRDRLEQAFAEHQSKNERSFDFFYQAQILWDETMAQSVDDYLKKNPDRQMVVLAGVGHLAYGSGIPKRSHRRNGYEYATILNDGDIDRDISDYLVFPAALEGVTAPKLMVVLKESAGRVVVSELPANSISKMAGIETGDSILAIDKTPVKSADDLKIELFYKKSGDKITVHVLRKRFLLGEKEMDISVNLGGS